MSTAQRLPLGGSRIDRERSVTFTFDGVQTTGFAGDTVASALLANGFDIVGRGIYSGRPRGIVAAGPEDPGTLLQVHWPGGASEPMLRATVVEIAEGMEVSSRSGRGRLVAGESGRFDMRYAHVEVLVVGGGGSGRAAAASAVADGPDDRVLLVDEGPVRASIDRADVLTRTTALGLYDHGYAVLAERRPGHSTEGRLWHVRAARIVLATGAVERPVAFPDNARPGVMQAGAAAVPPPPRGRDVAGTGWRGRTAAVR